MSLQSIINPITGQIDFIGDSSGGSSASFWKDPVANSSVLPSNGNQQGDARITLNNNHINVWNGTIWVDINNVISTSYKTEIHVLDSSDITSKEVNIITTPINSNLVRLTVIGGIEQENGIDFNVIGTTINWNGTFLESVLETGMKLIISYN